MRKKQSLQQVVLGKLDSHTQINKVRTHPHTMHRNKLKITENLNIKEDTIKLLEEIMSQNIL